MPQLYCQLANRPNPWLLGRTSAGLCTLQTACPLTVTYSGGSPAPDTIAAGSAATVYGGSAAAFDASADVWVVLTVPGSGVLQVVKEADLATVTGDWAGLARVVQHSTEPYQPQAYLASGGLGNQTGTTVTMPVSDITAKALSLWTGSTNSSPPASWETPGFDDSAWSAAVVALGGGTLIWSTLHPLANTEQVLVRQHFTLPAGTITAASLTFLVDDSSDGVWINGTLVAGTVLVDMVGGGPVTVSVPPSVLLAGQDNLIAVWGANHFPTGAGIQYSLSTAYAGAGQTVATSGTPAEGDLLYYHNGAWADLPLGTSGKVLTSNGTDPGWATPATSGTVTSVALSGPTGTTVSGSPVTSSGTLTLSWASQSANVVLAAPNGSSGAPTFRALVGADIPVDASTIISSAGTIKGNYQAGSGVSISGNTISATGSGGSVTSVALSVPSIFSVAGSPVTTTGTLAVTLATQSAHAVFAGPASGSAAAPTFRALGGSDLPAAAGAGGHIHAHGKFL